MTLEEQLQHVQEDLEHYFLRSKELEAQLLQARSAGGDSEEAVVLRATIKEKNKKLHALSQRKKETEAELKLQLEKLKKANLELQEANKVMKEEVQARQLKEQQSQTTRETVSLKKKSPLKAVLKNRAGHKRSETTLTPHAEKLKNSGYFSQTWYLEQYPDVTESGIEPVEHYLRFGGFEGRDPGPFFDSKWYLEQNPDVRATGMNPLLHFVEHGLREGRKAKP